MCPCARFARKKSRLVQLEIGTKEVNFKFFSLTHVVCSIMAFPAFEVRMMRDLRLFVDVRKKHEIGPRGVRDSYHISAGTIKKIQLEPRQDKS